MKISQSVPVIFLHAICEVNHLAEQIAWRVGDSESETLYYIRMSNRIQLTLMTLGLVLVAFSSAPAATECEGLRATFEKWVAAYANRDLAGTMSILADDLNFSFQGSADAKKGDLEKSYREEFSKPAQAKWVPKFEEFECSGDLGFVRSTWRLEVKGADGKIEIKSENRSVDILRRTANGEWKIFRSLNYPIVAAKE